MRLISHTQRISRQLVYSLKLHSFSTLLRQPVERNFRENPHSHLLIRQYMEEKKYKARNVVAKNATFHQIPNFGTLKVQDWQKNAGLLERILLMHVCVKLVQISEFLVLVFGSFLSCSCWRQPIVEFHIIIALSRVFLFFFNVDSFFATCSLWIFQYCRSIFRQDSVLVKFSI